MVSVGSDKMSAENVETSRPVTAPTGWCVLGVLLLAGMGWALVTNRFSSKNDGAAPFNKPPVFELDINSASADQLQALPEIGSMLAKRIVDYRTANGPFQSADDLVLVRGFGPTTMLRLRAMVVTN